MMPMDMDMGPGMWWMMAFGSLSFLLFWGAIIGVAIWAVNRLSPQRKDALKILEERYARGELNRHEFLRMRGELN